MSIQHQQKTQASIDTQTRASRGTIEEAGGAGAGDEQEEEEEEEEEEEGEGEGEREETAESVITSSLSSSSAGAASESDNQPVIEHDHHVHCNLEVSSPSDWLHMQDRQLVHSQNQSGPGAELKKAAQADERQATNFARITSRRRSSNRADIYWDQTDLNVNIYICVRHLNNISISIVRRVLKIEGFITERKETNDDESKLKANYQTSLSLFAEVNERKYHCEKFDDHIHVQLEKSATSQTEWPQLVENDRPCQSDKSRVCEDSSSPPREQTQTADSSDRKFGDNPEQSTLPPALFSRSKDCFEDIDLYLSQLNRQSLGPAQEDNGNDLDIRYKKSTKKTSDFDETFARGFERYYSKLNQTRTDSSRAQRSLNQVPTNTQAIKQPSYDEEIFNPFRKKSHNIINLPNYRSNMKYDYRRETNPSQGSTAMDSAKNTARHALDYRKTYLFLYNLALFVVFLMVFMILTIKTISQTMDDDTIRGAAFIIKLLTYTQLMESIHPLLGLVPGGPMMPFLQVIGRLIVNLFLSNPTIRMNSAPYAHYLFIVWSCIEIFRYSFYALRVFKVDIYPLTWCRYTLFLPLYPMGGFCESQVVMATINHYGKTGAYSINLPNSFNISFDLSSFLKFYTVFLLGPSIFYLMRYMWSQRCKQLKVKDKSA